MGRRKIPGMMTSQLTANVLNHLLAQNNWALPRLASFAGKTAHIEVAPFSFTYTILENGTLRSADAEAGTDVSCVIAPSLLPRLALHDEKAYAKVRGEGDAALLAEIFYLARNLRWDAAEDLSHITGDIVAERIVQAVQSGQQPWRDRALNLLPPAMECRTEEYLLLTTSQRAATLRQQVDTLCGDIALLGQRVQRLLATDKNY